VPPGEAIGFPCLAEVLGVGMPAFDPRHIQAIAPAKVSVAWARNTIRQRLQHNSQRIEPNRVRNRSMGMEDIEMIDFELWLISMIRAICRRERIRLPSIARADELLDERLSLQGSAWSWSTQVR